MKSMEKEEGRKENDKGSRDRGKEEKVSREEDGGRGASIILSRANTCLEPQASLKQH